MADVTYDQEVKSLQQFLRMQKPVSNPSMAIQTSVSLPDLDMLSRLIGAPAVV